MKKQHLKLFSLFVLGTSSLVGPSLVQANEIIAKALAEANVYSGGISRPVLIHNLDTYETNYVFKFYRTVNAYTKLSDAQKIDQRDQTQTALMAIIKAAQANCNEQIKLAKEESKDTFGASTAIDVGSYTLTSELAATANLIQSYDFLGAKEKMKSYHVSIVAVREDQKQKLAQELAEAAKKRSNQN